MKNKLKKEILSILTIMCLVAATFMLASALGCKSTPQQVAYQTAGITDVAVASALKGYNIAAKNGQTTVAQNQQVADAFGKYQKAMAVALDAGAVYAASGTSGTNTDAAAAALQQATMSATASLNDVINLIQEFTSTK